MHSATFDWNIYMKTVYSLCLLRSYVLLFCVFRAVLNVCFGTDRFNVVTLKLTLSTLFATSIQFIF